MLLEANPCTVIEGRGDREARRILFETYKDRVYSIALRYSGDPVAAMDISQDTFLKLFSSAAEFRGEASFDSWLYRVVVNSCLDHHRTRRRLTALVDAFLDAVAPSRETALSNLLRLEVQQQVQQVVRTLPPDQRMVVILRYTEGLSYEEISSILKCSMGTVASRLNRAHKALGRRLAHLRRGNHG